MFFFYKTPKRDSGRRLEVIDQIAMLPIANRGILDEDVERSECSTGGGLQPPVLRRLKASQ